MKKALRETQTLRALAVVRCGHRPPTRPLHIHRHWQDRLQYTSAQCNKYQSTTNHWNVTTNMFIKYLAGYQKVTTHPELRGRVW